MSCLDNKQNGFTLIELVLYVAVTSLIAGMVVGFAILIGQIHTKASIVALVSNEAQHAMHYIGRVVRSAEAISGPAPGGTSAVLELQVNGIAVVFEESGGVLQVTYGNSSPIELTSNQVVVEDISFSNFSRPATQGAIQYLVPMAYNDGGNIRFEFEFEQIFQGSASLRPN